MKTKGLLIGIGLLLLLPCAAKADYFYCGNSIITEGESEAEVTIMCGQPMNRFAISPQVIEETQGNIITRRIMNYHMWVYPYGDRGFYKYLKFENGQLISIKTGPYVSIPK